MSKEKSEWKKRFYDNAAFLEDGNLLAFFSGSHVNYRMDELRKSIHYVRDHWNDRKELIESIFRVFPSLGIDRQILLKKDWLDVADDKDFNKTDFSIIRKYTEQRGYDVIFSSMNRLLRDATATVDDFNAAALMVELLNIDLYNHMLIHSDASRFEGIVYRGLSVTTSVIEGLQDLFLKSAKDREFGIPLGFLSASRDRSVADDFTKTTRGSERKPLVLKIHVNNLSPELLAIYKSFYPNAVVSSLCSVPIYGNGISAYPNEIEVILRGAFFHILRIYEEKKTTVVEVCMLNANRDHIRTNDLNGTCAQKLFGKLVKLDKMRRCSDLMHQWNIESSFLYDEEAKKAAYELEEAIQDCKAEKYRKLKEVSR